MAAGDNSNHWWVSYNELTHSEWGCVVVYPGEEIDMHHFDLFPPNLGIFMWWGEVLDADCNGFSAKLHKKVMEDGGKLIDLGQPDHLHDQLTLAYSFKVGIYQLGITFSSFFFLLSSFFCLLPSAFFTFLTSLVSYYKINGLACWCTFASQNKRLSTQHVTWVVIVVTYLENILWVSLSFKCYRVRHVVLDKK